MKSAWKTMTSDWMTILALGLHGREIMLAQGIICIFTSDMVVIIEDKDQVRDILELNNDKNVSDEQIKKFIELFGEQNVNIETDKKLIIE